ncbi:MULTISPECIES: hypothetical protein [Streptomyces]|uniref:hypothetical protein n=1 Tax=Streptomyces TaxID=1883 RepID=UPI0004CDD587|nr:MULTISPECIES: hypothetical protein [Streptomyces]KOT57088.1 hypothetical protein ADK43_21925 [Streptomyces rimosus subsp. rimosus]
MTCSPRLRLLAQAFLSGVAGALVVTSIWLVAAGETPSPMTGLVCAQLVTTAWSLVQAARFRRKWQVVLASYNEPALGEGIDIPHRPPADNEEGSR